MKVPFLDLKRQYEQIKVDIEPKIIEVARSGAYIGGKYVETFEAEMREYLGVKHVISCANGTDALMIALRAFDVGVGDEVITTPFTFYATAEAIAAVGAVPVFVDVNESDFNIDPSKIEAAITPKTKAIMPVHIFGWSCDMEAINDIARKHNLKVVEDAAQAIGCEYNGRKIGASDNIVTFSFYPTKNLGAFGDAGMVTTDDDDLAIVLRALREHGMAKNGAMAQEILYGIKDEFAMDSVTDSLYNPYKYYNYIVGYNSRLDAMQAAILSIKLKHLDEYNKKRSDIASIYEKGLCDVVRTPVAPKNGKSCFHQYAVLTEDKEGLGAFLGEKGVGTGAFYPVPLHLQKAFINLGYKEGDLPVAEGLAKRSVCLPIFPELDAEEAEYVVQCIREFA
ncbi:MAG: DegT/DnrJ/EryC1/StrS family aminotransferase [Oscillospiraceae bacterium]|nr:DegT/DnrJ/EryC1/StrS family aminotransferase [Oscillospiraceae bacterium]